MISFITKDIYFKFEPDIYCLKEKLQQRQVTKIFFKVKPFFGHRIFTENQVFADGYWQVMLLTHSHTMTPFDASGKQAF